jgi:hypothetical protein
MDLRINSKEIILEKKLINHLISIETSYFSAGLVIGEKYNKCAPILHYMKDWDIQKIKNYCSKKGWKFQDLGE